MEIPWKFGSMVSGIGFIGASPMISPIGNSIEDVAGAINTFQYSLGISIGSCCVKTNGFGILTVLP